MQTIIGNTFKIEDLATHQAFEVSKNSPIDAALEAIAKFAPQLSAHFKIAAKFLKENDYTITKTNRCFEHIQPYEWRVTERNQVVLIKYPNEPEAKLVQDRQQAKPRNAFPNRNNFPNRNAFPHANIVI